MIDWKPAVLCRPSKMIDAPTAWDEMEMGLGSLVREFCEKRDIALEFGVQHGYSTVAISNYFTRMIGVDTFVGDPYSGQHYDNFHEVKDALSAFPNIALYQSDWEKWALDHDDDRFDLIHVDIFHTYSETYCCGRWAVGHSPVTIFHDTISFPEVMRAITDITREFDCSFYHWGHRHGLGILA